MGKSESHKGKGELSFEEMIYHSFHFTPIGAPPLSEGRQAGTSWDAMAQYPYGAQEKKNRIESWYPCGAQAGMVFVRIGAVLTTLSSGDS